MPSSKRLPFKLPTYQRIADEVGVSRTTVARWFSGDRPMPAHVLVTVCRMAPGVPMEALAEVVHGRWRAKNDPMPAHVLVTVCRMAPGVLNTALEACDDE